MLKFISVFMFSVVLISVSAYAEKTQEVKGENFRCEKLLGITLVEFKSALIENCNLNLPFSSSMSRVLNEESYFYCCQKK